MIVFICKMAEYTKDLGNYIQSYSITLVKPCNF